MLFVCHSRVLLKGIFWDHVVKIWNSLPATVEYFVLVDCQLAARCHNV